MNSAGSRPLPPPLDFGWPLRTLDAARTAVTVRPGGVMELTIDHDLLRGVTPVMLRWWFEHVHQDVSCGGRVWPLYRIWHPRDHIALHKPRLDRNGRIGEGAHFHIQEVFGRDERCRVDSVEFVEKLDDSGIRLLKFMGGVQIFSLEHWFTPTLVGTRYESQMLVGASSPLLGRLLNRWLMRHVFPESLGQAWLRHNVEQVGHFEAFLPALWAAWSPDPALWAQRTPIPVPEDLPWITPRLRCGSHGAAHMPRA